MKVTELFKPRWKPENAAKWERTRSKGKLRFIFLVGGLGWGGIMVVFMNLFHDIFERGPQESSAWAYFLVSVFLFPVGGVLWGLFTWTVTEALYQYYKSQKELNSLTDS